MDRRTEFQMNTIETKIIDNFLPEDVFHDFMNPLLMGKCLCITSRRIQHNPNGYNSNTASTQPLGLICRDAYAVI